MALRLRRVLADRDVLARVGDDEFAVLLDATSVSGIGAVAQRASACLEPPIMIDGVPVAVTVSWGAAVLGEGSGDFATVLQQAGAALFAAKAAEGRGVYEPRHEAADVSRIKLTAELREALAAGELLLHYQPQADLLTNRIRGVEALLRWQHPTRGLLPAAEFIRVAERSGFASQFRSFVLETAIAQWHEWSSSRDEPRARGQPEPDRPARRLASGGDRAPARPLRPTAPKLGGRADGAHHRRRGAHA